MQHAVPPSAKITKPALEDMEQYVLEFIKFLTSEGVLSPRLAFLPSIHPSLCPLLLSNAPSIKLTLFINFVGAAAANKSTTKRNILDGDDLLRAMKSTGFEHYGLVLGPYLEGFRARKREGKEARGLGREREG